MHNHHTEYSDLVCLECGSIFRIPRDKSAKRKIGHIKDIYCPFCQTVQKHYEVHDKDLFYAKYSNIDQSFLDEDIIKVLELIEGHKKDPQR